MKKLFSIIPLLIASMANAQVVTDPQTGGSSVIAGGTTVTSGCVAGGVLRSISNLVDCAEGLTYASDRLDFGTSSAFASITNKGRIYYNPTTGLTIQGSSATDDVNIITAAGNQFFRMSTGAVSIGNGATTTIGATIIGSASLGSTVVPLTARLGTGSTANVLELQNSAGTVLSYFNSAGNLRQSSSSGVFLDAANFVGLGDVANSLPYLSVSTGSGRTHVASYGLAFVNSMNATTGTADVFLQRAAAASLQMGADVNGAAVNQTFKAHDGITGTNISGANMTIAAGRGTGTGAGGTLVFQTAPVEASGTTAQTLVDRLTIQKDGTVYLGNNSPLSTASPVQLNLGGTYNSVVDVNALKLVMYDGGGYNRHGFGWSIADGLFLQSSLGVSIPSGPLAIGTGVGVTSKLYVGGVTGTTVAATINNGTSTGNILNLQDNGTNVFTVADGGKATGYVFESSRATSDTAFSGNNTYPGAYVGKDGYWALRSDTSHGFHIDVYNSGSPISPFGLTQAGVATINGVTMPVAGGIKLSTGTKPTCDSTTRGTQFYVAGGAGVADTYEVCRKDNLDVYAWVSIF